MKAVSPFGDTATPTITPSSDIFPFPYSLYCSDIQNEDTGPSWANLTIGQSTKDDLEIYIDGLDTHYSKIEEPDRIKFSVDNSREAEARLLPSFVNACITNDTITALMISTANDHIVLPDLIAKYGLPDAVTWTDTLSSRVAFWFKQGIAVDVSVKTETFGKIYLTVLFPYQDSMEYETQWPYNRTRQSPPPVGDVIYDPPLPTDENPFDFEAMVATITAQPSRTPTPTFAPLSSTPTPTLITLVPTRGTPVGKGNHVDNDPIAHFDSRPNLQV